MHNTGFISGEKAETLKWWKVIFWEGREHLKTKFLRYSWFLRGSLLSLPTFVIFKNVFKFGCNILGIKWVFGHATGSYWVQTLGNLNELVFLPVRTRHCRDFSSAYIIVLCNPYLAVFRSRSDPVQLLLRCPLSIQWRTQGMRLMVKIRPETQSTTQNACTNFNSIVWFFFS